MLKARVLTALLGVPLLVAVIWWAPGIWIYLVFALAGCGAWLEYHRLVKRPAWPLTACGFLGGQAVLLALAQGRPGWAWLALLSGLGGLTILAVFLFAARRTVYDEVSRLWLGLILIFTPLGLMAALASWPSQGRRWLLFLLAVVFATDTAAFFVGRQWGQRKLYPTLSPAKTWAGAWSGLAAGAGVGLLAGLTDALERSWGCLLFLGFSLSVAAQVGDLIVSMIKRTFEAKDAGRILPGHGGVLDRLDSFILAAPWLFLVLNLWRK